MTNVVEKRRRVLINTAYFALIFAVAFAAYRWLLPLLLPFIFAFAAAGILNRPISAIVKKTPLKRPWLSAGFVIMLVLIIAAVFFLIGIELVETVSGFYDYSVAQLNNITDLVNDLKLWILDITSFLPEVIRGTLHENVTLFFDNIIQNGFQNISIDTSMINWSELLSKGSEMITGTVGKIPSLIIAAIVFMISTVFISSDYDKIKIFFVKQVKPERARKISDAWHLGVNSLKKMIKAYCLIILITSFELTVGFYILKFIGVFESPYIIFISVAIAFIDIIPVLGTGTVLIPWAVISFITGNIGMGIGLLVMYVIILVIRQIIEPKLVAGQVGLPPIATIIAMYVGSKTLGVLGFFILPFIVILIKVYNDAGIIHVFKDVHEGEHREPQENGELKAE
ncbi:MAG: sporulation integral membrane protein YtvI [Clostridia bacterium]|nr:sporulation integral membrane protein YtvI [Clostridia bacterium]